MSPPPIHHEKARHPIVVTLTPAQWRVLVRLTHTYQAVALLPWQDIRTLDRARAALVAAGAGHPVEHVRKKRSAPAK